MINSLIAKLQSKCNKFELFDMVEEVEKLLLLFHHTIFELKDKSYLNIDLDCKSLRFIEFLDERVIMLSVKDSITIYFRLSLLILI